MQQFTVTGSLTFKPGGARHEFNCTTYAETVDEALDKFKEVYSPDDYKVIKITSVEFNI